MAGLNLTLVPGYYLMDGPCTRSSGGSPRTVLSDVLKHDSYQTFA